ncbi:MAG: FemAB family PEP-CTERM system-associated protein [Burkholderiaceae bacterium]|jgi:FemAB-related protein (PEP-CTERM system-associated)|nr:FemAB family PEP-CTERM system-associated protein [Burkholderiaceae bacterium]
MVQVNRLELGDAAAASRWDAFVRACPEATFCHLSGWGRALEGVFGHETHFLQATQAGRVSGVLPLALVKSRLFGNSLTSLPFCVYGGVAAEDAASAKALEDAAEALAQRLGVPHLELRHTTRRHPDWPEQDLYVTFRKPITADDEANMNAIPRKQRAMVRKGIKNGLASTVDDTVDRFFALYASNVHRHGTPALPKRWFQALQREFGRDCEVLTVTSPEGRPLSSVVTFFFRDEVLPYYAGDDEAARGLAANDFKYWELMRRAAARGCTLFDYGRSKRGTGPFDFKKNWGFEPTPLHYEYRLYKRDTVPQNNPSNAKYKLMIEGWRRLPLPVANWLGPFFVKSLG